MTSFVLLLSPFAPHIAEELWQTLGQQESIACAPWPEFNHELVKEPLVEVAVQIRGKVRSKINVPPDADQHTMLTSAKEDPKIAALLAGKSIIKEIVVPGRLVNFVIK